MSDPSASRSSSNEQHENYERDLLILYATETGTALEAAEQIAREALRRLFSVRLCSVDEYPAVRPPLLLSLSGKYTHTFLKEELVHESLVVFVVSTTGAGQEPRSMKGLWTMLLRSDLPSDLFEDMDCAVFGLGDSSYEKFCWAAKKLSRRLLSLGAREIVERGEADDQHLNG